MSEAATSSSPAILLGRAESDYTLMRRGARQAVKCGSRFETNGHRGAARQVDDFLQARSPGALCH